MEPHYISIASQFRAERHLWLSSQQEAFQDRYSKPERFGAREIRVEERRHFIGAYYIADTDTGCPRLSVPGCQIQSLNLMRSMMLMPHSLLARRREQWAPPPYPHKPYPHRAREPGTACAAQLNHGRLPRVPTNRSSPVAKPSRPPRFYVTPSQSPGSAVRPEHPNCSPWNANALRQTRGLLR